MVVRTNVMALNSHRNLGMVGNQQRNAAQRLSSGFRINTGADDAAGLAISEGMRAQIRGMNQASRNAQDGISVIQTADGYLGNLSEMTQRIRQLATQASNDTYSQEQRDLILQEITLIQTEMSRQIEDATFNGETLFGEDGLMDMDDGFHLQVGPDSGHVIAVSVEFEDLIEEIDDLLDDISAGDGHDEWTAFIEVANNLLQTINSLRADLGAYENKLEFTIQNLDLAAENMSAAESRIRDADMAQEMMRLTQANVLQQAATAMLAQANQAPQSILQLLG